MKLNKLLFLLFLVGCKQRTDPKDLNWLYMKSPLSGKCYEVVQSYYPYATNAVLAISEVSCVDIDRSK